MKALLGWQEISGVWSDQPPVLNKLHVYLFHLLGPSAGILRALDLCFSGALLAALVSVLRKSHCRVVCFVALLLLSTSSGFITLSVACLIGLPAYAWAMLACACLISGISQGRQSLIFYSGLLLGFGAHTKLSALLVLPGIAVCVWRLDRKGAECPWAQSHAMRRWLSGFSVSFFGIWLLRPETVVPILSAHWGSATRNAFEDYPAAYLLVGRLLLDNWLLSAPALLGLMWGVTNKRTETLLPGIWFLTALGVHLWHRPFWQHHFLHLSVPMAWLAGLFIGEMMERFKAVTWEQLMGRGGSPLIPAFPPSGGEGGNKALFWRGPRFAQAAAWVWLLLPCLFLSALLVELPGKWAKETAFLRVDDSKDWECVGVMKGYKAQTKWVFADAALYPFHAGMSTPPEIAVLSYKRLQAGLITQPELLNLLVHYRAEQVLVRRQVFGEKFMSYVGQHYTPVFEHGSLQLFIRNDVVKHAAQVARPKAL